MISPVSTALARDEDGATIVEFALIAPTLLLMLIGMFDISYNIYSTTLLQGSVQKAARSSTLEGASDRAIDARVRSVVRDLVPDAKIAFARRSYAQYSDVGRAEDFEDIDGNGRCNAGEAFEDANGNAYWDDERGADGMGGARDAVLYTVDVEYPRAFPLAAMIGISPVHRTRATTILRNQPFDGGQATQPTTRYCP